MGAAGGGRLGAENEGTGGTENGVVGAAGGGRLGVVGDLLRTPRIGLGTTGGGLGVSGIAAILNLFLRSEPRVRGIRTFEGATGENEVARLRAAVGEEGVLRDTERDGFLDWGGGGGGFF